jgi:hypothetical protein
MVSSRIPLTSNTSYCESYHEPLGKLANCFHHEGTRGQILAAHNIMVQSSIISIGLAFLTLASNRRTTQRSDKAPQAMLVVLITWVRSRTGAPHCACDRFIVTRYEEGRFLTTWTNGAPTVQSTQADIYPKTPAPYRPSACTCSSPRRGRHRCRCTPCRQGHSWSSALPSAYMIAKRLSVHCDSRMYIGKRGARVANGTGWEHGRVRIGGENQGNREAGGQKEAETEGRRLHGEEDTQCRPCGGERAGGSGRRITVSPSFSSSLADCRNRVDLMGATARLNPEVSDDGDERVPREWRPR